MKTKYTVPVFFILVASAIFAPGCSSGKEVIAGRSVGTIVVDGKDIEWQEGLISQDNALVGFRTDGNYLYCTYITGDRSKARQIMMAGLITTFENADTKTKMGVKFPQGFRARTLDEQQAEPQGFDGRAPEQGRPEKERMMPQNIAILDKDGNQVSELLNNEEHGVGVAIGHDGPRLIYEMRIPLAASGEEYALPLKAGDEVKITMKTAAFDREKMKERMKRGGAEDGDEMRPPADMPGGGRGAGRQGGMRPGGGQGGPGGGERNRPDSESTKIDMVFKVKLAGN